MSEIRQAAALILKSHELYPALALDAASAVLDTNTGALTMMGLGRDALERINLMDLVFAPGRVRTAIKNWPEVARIPPSSTPGECSAARPEIRSLTRLGASAHIPRGTRAPSNNAGGRWSCPDPSDVQVGCGHASVAHDQHHVRCTSSSAG
ncbi:hypothetical protein [Myxococcus stipitatus]|uniref:MmyB family transcriptional regulator n=1 Tax=Myxococcus stipitatus TaxID=83455 RepID=UPI0030D08702